ncbi:MAG: bifunctional anthranilate synthase component II/anthranilate phosphoribosyltransferase [Spirochaetales bacterium]|nr:bifunctional anthranilate synthase component II/anthranilate phosphoribosyltransferase [Spirochaetales bacterium]
MYVLIDNYDSFTYNLFQYICEITDDEVKVIRNDAVKDIKEIAALNPKAIIISPGPGRPEDAGISVDAVKYFSGKVPILGVCLGHQVIAYVNGAQIKQAQRIVHGKVEDIILDGKGLFRNIPSPARFTRYHSLAVQKATLPDFLEITAYANDGEIMGLRHKRYIVEGIQFHPESMASDFGKRLLKNFLYYKSEAFNTRDMLSGIISKNNMSFDEAESFMDEVTEGNFTNAQLAAFLTALNAKGPSPEEIAGCASILKKKRTVFTSSNPVLDTCGTGGDELGTFNISSLSALAAAACGAYVAKHGNRAVSSKSGSADFYKELGIKIDLSPGSSENLLEKTGFAFLFAPLYHKAMKHAVEVRRELRIKTIFNLIGPLSNPAGSEYQLIGVYSADLCIPVARAARLLGVKRVMVVHGLDGMDEISVSSVSKIVEINEEGQENEYVFDPRTIGVQIYRSDELKGGDAKKNSEIAHNILSGKGHDAIKEAVLLNTGAALYIAGIAESIQAGYLKAKNAFQDGSVKAKIEQIIKESQALV